MMQHTWCQLLVTLVEWVWQVALQPTLVQRAPQLEWGRQHQKVIPNTFPKRLAKSLPTKVWGRPWMQLCSRLAVNAWLTVMQ